MQTNGKVWFLTGASRGFGRLWTEAALRRGDVVAASARDPHSLDDLAAAHGDALLPLRLDVTDRNAVFEAVRRTADTFGRLDVVVNNAGYGHFGAVEELTENEIRAQLETNFLGALWVLQAALPIMREQRGGHLVNVTSEGGVRAYPGIGAYHASKWALEGLSESLAKEVRDLGIRVTNVEPGPYGTGWLEVGSRRSAPIAAYDPLRAGAGTFELGDPAATVPALFAVVDADEPPLRVFFGRSFEPVREEHMARIAEWERWQDVALAAFGPVAAR
ncbi:SDR family NAD(P)-dependent oxidoreductase [Pseudonocardia kunmingensis]|uniref:NADP-dependent 3-hydroxy acid dehydrogenase YdfG n=1 Tax=Pseudonocardia kunmingensis TaxID=630975 RepID=A0A543E125_9PSEU|nr:SDR family NAD(P)-dependent oxidoreductase [Pseudonocardia kunmingensis]TQM15286.1 NADP-dependent 3-hydroxy acid dehydrogenase YdfG [Pseudonocardia kunmingensis]